MLFLDPCFAKVCEINERCVALWNDKTKCGKYFASNVPIVVVSMLLFQFRKPNITFDMLGEGLK